MFPDFVYSDKLCVCEAALESLSAEAAERNSVSNRATLYARNVLLIMISVLLWPLLIGHHFQGRLSPLPLVCM